ncbi:MAG: FCD domain-containing protein [Pseudomonadota bacterium]|nr:FCD domain-containing protein [Pseudomonadota bacterium]
MSDKVSQSVTVAAYERLRRDLITGVLPPGSRLKISDLCQSTAINLSAIREALSKLSAEGLVIALPQRGFRAAPVSPTDLMELTRARIEIETVCLRSSLQLGDVDWESAVVAASHAMDRTPPVSPVSHPAVYARWCEVHERFHRALCSACDNSRLLRIRDMLYVESERYRYLATRFAGSRRAATEEHHALVEAALARDGDRLAKIITAHFEITTADLLNSLKRIVVEDGADLGDADLPAALAR